MMYYIGTTFVVFLLLGDFMEQLVINQDNFVAYIVFGVAFFYLFFKDGYETGVFEQYAFDVYEKRIKRRKKIIDKIKQFFNRFRYHG